MTFFAKLGKDAFDLLKDKTYDLKSQLEIKAKADAAAWEGNVTLDDAKMTGKVKVARPISDKYGKVTAEIDTQNVTKLEYEKSGLVPNLNLKTTLDLLQGPASGALEAKYAHERATLQVDLKFKQSTVTAETSTLIKVASKLSVGGMVAYRHTADSDEVTDYNGAVQFKGEGTDLVIKTENSADTISTFFTHTYSPTAWLLFGFKYSLSKDTRVVSLGGKYVIDGSSAVKGFIATDGKARVHYAQTLSDVAKVEVGTQFDALRAFDKVGAAPKIGVKLSLGDF
jgi:hypothetical protein